MGDRQEELLLEVPGPLQVRRHLVEGAGQRRHLVAGPGGRIGDPGGEVAARDEAATGRLGPWHGAVSPAATRHATPAPMSTTTRAATTNHSALAPSAMSDLSESTMIVRLASVPTADAA